VDFGFTNNEELYQQAGVFRDAAAADGWEIEPTYGTESVDRAASLTKDDFVMRVLSRTHEEGSKWKYQAEVYIWGPDGLAINPPNKYDFEAIKEKVESCGYCNAKGVPTQRVGFAGRSCETCLPEQKKIQEYPGWTN